MKMSKIIFDLNNYDLDIKDDYYIEWYLNEYDNVVELGATLKKL